MSARKRNVYIAIMVAAAHGRGLHLTADEVGELAFDDAIETHAANCLDEGEWPEAATKEAIAGAAPVPPPGWEVIDPYRKRTAANLAV